MTHYSSTAAIPGSGAAGRDDRLAARLRGFGIVGLAAWAAIYIGSVALPGLGALLVAAWAYRSRTAWADLGFARPHSWMRTIAIGLALGVPLRLFTKLVLLPLLDAPPNPAFQYLEGNTAA